jgi:hypothetical protein
VAANHSAVGLRLSAQQPVPAGWFNAGVGTDSEDFLELVAQLPGAERSDSANWSTFRVRGQTFGYLWERTQTVGLKQTLSEQLALVAERPDVFEVQFTAGQFGWVVVYLAKVDRRELAELTYEAWSLSAPAALLDAAAGQLPS